MAINFLVFEPEKEKRIVKVHSQKSETVSERYLPSSWCASCRLICIEELGVDLKNKAAPSELLFGPLWKIILAVFVFWLLFILLNAIL